MSVPHLLKIANKLTWQLQQVGYEVRWHGKETQHGTIYLMVRRSVGALWRGPEPKEKTIRVSTHPPTERARPHDHNVAVGYGGTRWWEIGIRLAKEVGADLTPQMVNAAEKAGMFTQTKPPPPGAMS